MTEEEFQGCKVGGRVWRAAFYGFDRHGVMNASFNVADAPIVKKTAKEIRVDHPDEKVGLAFGGLKYFPIYKRDDIFLTMEEAVEDWRQKAIECKSLLESNLKVLASIISEVTLKPDP